MYEYKFVETSLDGFSFSSYRETINEYAKEGWRLVQVLPLNYNANGKPTIYEIILERIVEG